MTWSFLSGCSISVVQDFNGVLCYRPKQGGIDESEDPKSAAVRELKEETGISSAEVLAEVWLYILFCYFITFYMIRYNG